MVSTCGRRAERSGGLTKKKDEVYVVYFKTNRKCVREYRNLSNYVRDLFQTPGIGESVNMEDIKTHYFTSHPHLNPFGIVPRGPAVDFGAPHRLKNRR